MSKKAKIVPEKIQNFGIVKQIQTVNFKLFKKTEINFINSINVIDSTSLIDKILLKFMFNIALNPEIRNFHKKIDISTFNMLQEVKIDSKKDISFLFIFYFPQEKLTILTDDFKSNFIFSNEMKIQIEVNDQKDILTKIFHFSKQKFASITPTLEFQYSELIYNSIWLVHSFYPYLNPEKIFEIVKYDSVQLFDFILNHLELGDLKKQFIELKENINLTKLERDHFQSIRQEGFKTKADLEKDLKILQQIKDIDEQVAQLETEKDWADYFNLKSKFESKTSAMELIKSKLPGLLVEKENLVNSLEKITVELENLRNELENVTAQYDNKRKSFLAEKALLDKVDRNLKNWETSVSKAEKDFKFKNMKLLDKEKKLKDLDTRIAKEPTDVLVSQKEKLEKEIIKDKNDLASLQQNLDAIKNEKNLKSKERSIKEKNSQSKNELLAELTVKIASHNEKISEFEKERENLQSRFNNFENSIEKSQNEISILEKEIKELSEALSVEMDKLKSKNVEIPDHNRSLSTIRILQNQLENEKSQLQLMVSNMTNHDVYKNHLLFLESIDSELQKREKELDNLMQMLFDWEKKWDLEFNEKLESIEKVANELLNNFGLSINFSRPISDLPDLGAMTYNLTFKEKETKITVTTNTFCNELLVSLFSFISSALIVNKTNFYIFDIFDTFNFPKSSFESLLEEFITKYNNPNTNSTNFNLQTIIFANNETLKSFPALNKFLIFE